MDGSTNELAAAGYGRSAELRQLAERWAKREALKLADWLASERRSCGRHIDDALRGLPTHTCDWPEWCWERACEHDDAIDVSERDLLAMRSWFCIEAALVLGGEDHDCR